jgi:hypothetical protein
MFSSYLVLVLLACGGADIGEACPEVGEESGCVDGAVCTNQADGAKICRQLCVEHSDCPSTTSCNGISKTNLKSFQPD